METLGLDVCCVYTQYDQTRSVIPENKSSTQEPYYEQVSRHHWHWGLDDRGKESAHFHARYRTWKYCFRNAQNYQNPGRL